MVGPIAVRTNSSEIGTIGTDCASKLSIINHKSISGCALLVLTYLGVPTPMFQVLQATGYRLQATGYRLRASGV